MHVGQVDASSFGVRRKSNFEEDFETGKNSDHFYFNATLEANVEKMKNILVHLLTLADDKIKTDSLSKLPKPTIRYTDDLSSYKIAPRQLPSGRKATNFDHQDELARPVQTLESITHIFSTVVKVLFGYEFSEKPHQDLHTLLAKRKEISLDRRAWFSIKLSFDEAKRLKMDQALEMANKLLLSREKYVKNIQIQRIILVATTIFSMIFVLLSKKIWTYTGLGACSINAFFMFTQYISSTETQAKLACGLKLLVSGLEENKLSSQSF